MTVYDFISKKENSTGKLFESWSLTQLGEYMLEYAKLANSSSNIKNVSKCDCDNQTNTEAWKCNKCGEFCGWVDDMFC